MTLAIVLEIALKSALIAGAALALLAVLKRLPAAQRAFVAHVGLAIALMTPLWVLFGPRLEMTGFWSRTPEPVTETPITSTTTPAASIPSDAPALTAETIALSAYALIAGLLLAALVVSLWRLLRLQRDAAVLTEPTWLMALAHAQQRMGMKQGTALLQNGRLSSPVSWGFLRPTIMVNPAILESGEKAEAVLANAAPDQPKLTRRIATIQRIVPHIGIEVQVVFVSDGVSLQGLSVLTRFFVGEGKITRGDKSIAASAP